MSAKNLMLRQLQWVDSLFGQPCGILKRLPNILLLQIGISLNDLLRTHPVGDQIQDKGNRNTHASDACFTTHDIGIKGDAIKL